MYVIAWDSPSGLVSYGPFLDKDEGFEWYHKRSAFVDPTRNRITGYMLTAPFEQPDYGSGETVPGPLYHATRDADDRAAGFICTVVVSETVSFGVGAFSERETAEAWFYSQRTRFDGAAGLVMPLLSPAG